MAIDVRTDEYAEAAGTEADAVDEGHPVLLFDGVCNLCSGIVQFVIERDPEGRFRFAPLQSAVAEDLLAETDVDPTDLDSFVYVDGDRVYTRSDAALRVVRHLDGPISLLWHARYVPRVLREAGYRLVAATRYDLFGRKDRCMVPSPEVRERFLATSEPESE